jgi:arsenate reductase
MAEAFLKHYAGEQFEVESAGLLPGNLNPIAVETMKEEGIDISANRTKKASDFVEAGKRFDYVITVCDQASAQECPYFPGVTERLHWSFEDPSAFTGSHEEKMMKTRNVRDKIKAKVLEFIRSLS